MQFHCINYSFINSFIETTPNHRFYSFLDVPVAQGCHKLIGENTIL